jgi:hypothetical protein
LAALAEAGFKPLRLRITSATGEELADDAAEHGSTRLCRRFPAAASSAEDGSTSLTEIQHMRVPPSPKLACSTLSRKPMRLTTLAGVRTPLCMKTTRSPVCKLAVGRTGEEKDMISAGTPWTTTSDVEDEAVRSAAR